MRLLLRTVAPSTTFYIIPNESSFNADSYHYIENTVISAHNIWGGGGGGGEQAVLFEVNKFCVDLFFFRASLPCF